MRSALALSHDGNPIKFADGKSPAECTHCKMPSTMLIIVNLYHDCEWQLCPACGEQVAKALNDGIAKWKATYEAVEVKETCTCGHLRGAHDQGGGPCYGCVKHGIVGRGGWQSLSTCQRFSTGA